MPNYVQNILNIEGDKKEVDRVLKAVSNAYRAFDFERLIPMPRELEIEAGTRKMPKRNILPVIQKWTVRYGNSERKPLKTTRNMVR